MNELIKRLRAVFYENKIPGPYKIELWPTQLCNLNCKYCRPENYVPDKKEISDKRLLELIDEAASLDVKEVIIAGGGEPLVRKEIVMKIMERIKEKNMKGSLTTNGVLLNKEDVKGIVGINWDNLFFSIDGPNESYNDELRKKGSFRKAVENIGFLNHFKKKLSSKRPSLGISMVLTRTNYKALFEMFELAKKLKIDCLVVNPIKGNNTEYNERLKLRTGDIEILRKELPKIRKYADKNKIQNTLDTLDTDLVEKSSDRIQLMDVSFFCFEPFTSVLINSFGGIGPCCERPDDYNQDSILNKSLKEVWYGEYFREIRNKNYKNKKCFYCNAWKITDTCNIQSLFRKNERKN